ncbi:MAG TPA: hypothetical protein VMW91_02055 [Desulfosporosinus sp.]|nr:hypothetical protein [Desulfosporosinus sp.]
MAIDDTIKILAKIYQSIDRGIPKTAASPDALVNHLNDLYAESIEGFASQELFAYDDVESPSITLTISIDVEFDLKRVMENMRKRLHARRRGKADALGKTGIVWSYGHYDFIYDDDSGLLRISHKYGHKREDTKSVLSIIKKMIDYAKDYIEEVKKSAEESTSTPETE